MKESFYIYPVEAAPFVKKYVRGVSWYNKTETWEFRWTTKASEPIGFFAKIKEGNSYRKEEIFYTNILKSKKFWRKVFRSFDSTKILVVYRNDEHKDETPLLGFFDAEIYSSRRLRECFGEGINISFYSNGEEVKKLS